MNILSSLAGNQYASWSGAPTPSSNLTCFAIRSTDVAGNVSDWSNIAGISVP